MNVPACGPLTGRPISEKSPAESFNELIREIAGMLHVSNAHVREELAIVDNDGPDDRRLATKNAIVLVRDSRRLRVDDARLVYAMDLARVVVVGTGIAIARGSASVRGCAATSVHAYDYSKIELVGEARGFAYDRATVDADDRAIVRAFGALVHVRLRGRATAMLVDGARADLAEHAKVDAHESSRVVLRDDAIAILNDQAIGEAHDRAVLIQRGKGQAVAFDDGTIIDQTGRVSTIVRAAGLDPLGELAAAPPPEPARKRHAGKVQRRKQGGSVRRRTNGRGSR